MHKKQKKILDIPEDAKVIHHQIVEKLLELERAGYVTCLERKFKTCYKEVFDLFDVYQQKIQKHSSMKNTCSRGCSYCCNHWVEDVNSFEGEIIAEYIRDNLQDKIEIIVSACESDLTELQRLESIIGEKMLSPGLKAKKKNIDNVDLLLSVFYQMQRPCPLIDEDGACSIYPVRPLTCRIYMSFAHPSRCHPFYINDKDIPTYLMNLEEDASEILDRLHFKYQKYEGNTGLRSLLLSYLSE